MPDRPVIFSAPMVRALLDGRKTMTRRLAWKSNGKTGDAYVERAMRSPWQRVQPGDRLWVRESITLSGACVSYLAGGPHGHRMWPTEWRSPSRPSIHMPRWASRLTLEVTAVRVQRLQEISEADARAEGIAPLPQQSADDPSAWWQSEPGKHQARDPASSFRLLWNALHGPCAWDANPDVVVISFNARKGNIDA